MSPRILFRSLSLLAAAFLLNGCTGYQLGSMLPDDIRTVYVPNFTNETQEPFLVAETTRAVIREIQTDGSLQIVDEAEADAILEVSITKYELVPLAYSEESRSRPDQYRVYLESSVTFRRSNGEILVRNPRVRGETNFDYLGDLTNTKRQALPNAAEDLAHDIVELLVEAWF